MRKSFLIILFIIQTFAAYGQGGSVVCIHGFFRSYRCMLPLANTLRNEGLNVYLWDYPSRKRTIEEHADYLVEVLQAIALQHPGEPIHFVSHSLGGLIVRAVVNHPNCPPEAKIGKGILLAPPNQGACLARQFQGWPIMRGIFGQRAGYQLMTFGKNEMAELGDFPPSMQIMVIAGKKGGFIFSLWSKAPNDGKVAVAETRLNGPHIHKTLYVSHHWIMTSRQSIFLTRDFILENEPAPRCVAQPFY